MIVAPTAMHPVKEGWGAEFLALNENFLGRWVERHATCDEGMLPINDQWLAISSAADGMGAIQAEVLQNLQSDFFPRQVRRKRSCVIQFTFSDQRRAFGRIEGKNKVM